MTHFTPERFQLLLTAIAGRDDATKTLSPYVTVTGKGGQ